jgi:hypothetical protein
VRLSIDHYLLTYLDLAVGAMNTVVVLRSRPIHEVRVDVQFADKTINWQKADTCSGLVNLGGVSNAAADRRQLNQLLEPAEAARCGDSDIVIGDGELTERLDKDTTFCLLTTLVFNYLTPEQDPLRRSSSKETIKSS